MTLTLTLSPGREAWLHEKARLAGLPVEEYALRVLDGAGLNAASLDAPSPSALPPGSEEWERELRGGMVSVPPVSLARRLELLRETPPIPAGRIPLSEDALRRETMYAEDGR